MRQIVVIGDSMTAFSYKNGWVTQLAAAHAGLATIVNAGVCGYNTRWMLENLRSENPLVPPTKDGQEPPLCVVVWLGGNDCATLDSPEAIPFDEFIHNYTAIVEWVQTAIRPECGVLVVTPAPPHPEQWNSVWLPLKDKMTGWAPSSRSVEMNRIYAYGALHVAKRLSVPVVNMFEVFGVSSQTLTVESHWEEMFEDGLHFNQRGHNVAFKAIMDGLLNGLSLEPSLLPLRPNISVSPYTTPAMPKVVLLGDSLTANGFSSPWIGYLGRHFSHCAQLINAGLSLTTEYVVDSLNSDQPFLFRMISPQERPLLTTIWFGMADAIAGVPVAAFRNNLVEITRWVRQSFNSQVLLITPPPHLVHDVRNYRAAVLSVAHETSTMVVDLFDDLSNFYSDGSLTVDDATVVYKFILAGVRSLLGDPKSLPPFVARYTDLAVADRLRVNSASFANSHSDFKSRLSRSLGALSMKVEAISSHISPHP